MQIIDVIRQKYFILNTKIRRKVLIVLRENDGEYYCSIQTMSTIGKGKSSFNEIHISREELKLLRDKISEIL